MKKALVISYYWPPAGGGGVQRVAKFCKYMRDFGWEPIVLTVENGNYPATDESLVADVADIRCVYKARTLEPHTLYRALTRLVSRRNSASSRSSKPSSPSWLSRLGETVRLNLFIPDSRIGWRRHAQRVGDELIRTEKPDVIFSSAPPYTPHLIAQHLSAKHGIPWIADFRDPWLENHAYNTAPRLGVVKRINYRLEQSVLRTATRVTCANPGIQSLVAKKLTHGEHDKCVVITNGYDRIDLNKPKPQGDHFMLSYFGTVYGAGFPTEVFTAIGNLIRSDAIAAQKIRLRIVGQIHPDIATTLNAHLPEANLELRPYVPHRDMLNMLAEPQVLMLVINQFPHNTATVPGKIYEYMPTGNPILGIGPVDGDAAALLKEAAAGAMIGHGQQGQIEAFLSEHFKAWQLGQLNGGSRLMDQFDRRNLTDQLTKLFSEVAP